MMIFSPAISRGIQELLVRNHGHRYLRHHLRTQWLDCHPPLGQARDILVSLALRLAKRQELSRIELQQATCSTVLSWNRFVPRLAEYGRTNVPRKWGRLLHRLSSEA